MFNHHCMVCREPNKFRNQVSYANIVSGKLENLLSCYNQNQFKENDRDVALLRRSKPHIHIMCGHCYKINEMEFSNSWDRISHKLARIKSIITSGTIDKDKQKKLKLDSIESVRWHFPFLYNFIDDIDYVELKVLVEDKEEN